MSSRDQSSGHGRYAPAVDGVGQWQVKRQRDFIHVDDVVDLLRCIPGKLLADGGSRPHAEALASHEAQAPGGATLEAVNPIFHCHRLRLQTYLCR